MCAHSISTPISSRAPDKGLRQRDRITAHLLETEPVLLPDARLDRVTARNTMFTSEIPSRRSQSSDAC